MTGAPARAGIRAIGRRARAGIRAIGRDRGSGSVAFLGLAAVAGVVLVLVLALASAVLAGHRAAAAADLAALAAAGQPLTGQSLVTGQPGQLLDRASQLPPGCPAAARVAAANAARLVGCRHLPDGSWLISVEVAVAGLAGRVGPAGGIARSGYADP